MIIVWDEPKRLENIAKHGFDFTDLDQTFFDGADIAPAKFGRHRAVGQFGPWTITVIFQRRGNEAIPVVSMRRASQKERNSE